MRSFNVYFQRTAIVLGMGAALAVVWFASWYLNPRNHCVRTISNMGKAANGQEIVYTWGCIQPQRFRQWSVVALRDFFEKREF